MSESASTASGIAGRYALAVFDLVKEGNGIKSLEADVGALEGAFKDSAEFRELILSPVYSRDDQANAVAAIAAKMKLSDTLGKTLGLMASNRRLFVLPQLLSTLKDMIAEEKGEVTAEVTSAADATDVVFRARTQVRLEGHPPIEFEERGYMDAGPAEAAVAAMKRLPNVVMPFPGGVVRSGSKVGSKYPALGASTNDAFCPSLVGLVPKSELSAETRCVMEIVIDGLTEADVGAAMRVGMEAGIAIGAAGGLLRISAGNYGGKLGPFHFHLHKLLGEAT